MSDKVGQVQALPTLGTQKQPIIINSLPASKLGGCCIACKIQIEVIIAVLQKHVQKHAKSLCAGCNSSEACKRNDGKL